MRENPHAPSLFSAGPVRMQLTRTPPQCLGHGRSSAIFCLRSGDCPSSLEDGQRWAQGFILTWREPERLVTLAGSSRLVLRKQILSGSAGGPLCRAGQGRWQEADGGAWVGWRWDERTQTDEAWGEDESRRAEPSKGQGKEEAEGESRNYQTVQQGAASGEKVVSSSPLSSSPKFLPVLCLFLCFSLFSTYPLQLHFQNHTLILKIHS